MAREMPKFSKTPPDIAAAFDAATPARADVQRRTMFGCPALFVKGNMFAFAFGPRVAVRLDEAGRAKAITGGASVFEMMPGKPMGEYIAVPTTAIKSTALRKWIADGLASTERLPAKSGATKKTAAATKTAAMKKTVPRKTTATAAKKR